MILTVKKIVHRGVGRKGIFLPYVAEANQKVKSIGAIYAGNEYVFGGQFAGRTTAKGAGKKFWRQLSKKVVFRKRKVYTICGIRM